MDRGMEEALEALKLLPANVILLIVGNGDAVPDLVQQANDMGLSGRVIFKPKQPYHEMLQYTLSADCGLSLDKPLSPNYKFSLPNKVFDYIKCGLPLVVSDVVEVQKVVRRYDLGEVIVDHQPQSIANSVLEVMKKSKHFYKEQLLKAAAENNWEMEQEVWKQIFRKYL